jgi:cell filamentation protein
MPSRGPRQYEPPTGVEAEWEQGSGRRVLRNLVGIRRKREMDRAEYEALLRVQEHYLRRIGPGTRFTAALLREMHRDWLGALYEWAGRYRTLELSKGEFHWPPAFLVAENMIKLEQGLLRAHTPCRPGKVSDIARRIAEVHAELLLVHPFREGNGRLARWLADLMALQANLPAPDYRLDGRGSRRQRLRYLETVQRGYLQDYGALTDFFCEALDRRLARGR